MLTCPGTHHMQGRLLLLAIIGALHALAVYRDNLRTGLFNHLAHPAQKTTLHWIDTLKHPSVGVGGTPWLKSGA